MTIRIVLDGRKKGETDKGFPVVVDISSNYKQRRIRTGFYSKKNHWHPGREEPKTSHPQYYVIMDYLEKLKNKIGRAVSKSSLEGLSIDEAAELIFRRSYKSFYQAALDALPDPDNYDDTRLSAINKFNELYPDLGFQEITPFTVEAFKNTLLAAGNKPGGVDSYLRSLRAMWNKTTDQRNPFSGYKIVIPGKVNRVATTEDLKKLEDAQLEYTGPIGGPGQYRDYWLLMFYLGGIDPEALSRLRYDENVVGGRIQFNRQKGGSAVACNNIIPDKAWEILRRYDCQPYLVPIHLSGNYTGFEKNFNNRFQKLCVDLELSVKLRPKSARYTFIDRAQQLLVDERITAQIVGHKRKTTTSLYTNDFPLQVQDQAHLRIISI